MTDTSARRDECRLTPADLNAVRVALRSLIDSTPEEADLGDVHVTAARAIGCHPVDLRDAELAVIETIAREEAHDAEPSPTATCPEHGAQEVVGFGATRGPDPYGIDVLACGHDVICLGPGEPYVIVGTRR